MSKQLKISELKRVVNIDEVTRLASVLRDESSPETALSAAIDQLSTKMPSKEVLMKTKLGFILKDLAKNEKLSKNVREKAVSVRRKWKEFHKSLLLAQKLDVKCDKPTTERRQSARISLMKTVYSVSDINKELATAQISDLEFYVFQYCDSLINWKYTSIIKSCTALLRDDSNMARLYINGKASAKDVLTRAIDNRQKPDDDDDNE